MLKRIPLPSQFDRIIISGGITVGAIGLPLGIVLVALVAFGVISAPEMVFFVAAFIVILGALGCVLLPNIVHAALSLTATLIGVAALYLLLMSEFLALVQVLVYGGGVVLLLLFGLMMTNAQDDPVVTDGSQKPFAFLLVSLLIGTFITLLLAGDWGNPTAHVVPFELFGERLFREFAVPIIIVAVLLDVAITGALVNVHTASSDLPEESE
ncbi:MAG TPA: NADH-quinone oxidoreductase subunit J [Dehalococcoidia bacterium]|jgi:NADH-quinone oxidoreductase subunit J|nr:NADH-quinone oxidoreductase subunit J [Dehalococcoidia bacterium]